MKERSFAFGPAQDLVGTVTLPDAGSAAQPVGVLLFNAGIVHRVGPHRLNVRLARALATAGFASIRFDLAGHGDSARLTGEHSFEEQAVVDLRSAIDALSAAAGTRRIAVFGLCSGGYHAFAAALADPRIGGLLIFDAFRYPTSKTRLIHYLRGLREPQFARRVVGFVARRGADLARALTGRPAAGTESVPPPELGRVNFVPPRDEVGAGLRALTDRGVLVELIFSNGALDDYNYQNQFRDTFAQFGIADRIKSTFLPDLDHQATGLAEQKDLIGRIVRWAQQVVGTRALAA